MICLLNNIQLGAGQSPIRTDNSALAKLNKVRWAQDYARKNRSILLLTGRLFDKSSSISDLSYIMDSGVLDDESTYLVVDYPSYRKHGKIEKNHAASILERMIPGKIISEYKDVEFDIGEKAKFHIAIGDIYCPNNDPSCDSIHLVFDYAKRLSDRFDDRVKRLYVTSKSNEYNWSGSHLYLPNSFRGAGNILSIPSMVELFVCPGDGVSCREVVLPHKTHVLEDDIISDIDVRDKVYDQASINISERFHPLRRHKESEKTLISSLNDLYDKDRISKDTYDIISSRLLSSSREMEN